MEREFVNPEGVFSHPAFSGVATFPSFMLTAPGS